MLDPNVQTRIEKFAAVFHSYVCNVSSVDLGPDAKRYRKILYFSLLEALSKARYPTRRPGNAFSSFVVTCCGWADGDKVSLPHLVAALERTAEPAFNDLRDFAYPELKKWGSGGPLWIDRDLDKADVQQRWPKNGAAAALKIPELDLNWTALQHRDLLYSYRSKLSHESRQPTLSFEEPADQRPYYESVERLGNPFTEWHLVYPSGFLAAACRTGIERLKVWLMAESKDPYKQFLFGRFLIEKLNDPDIKVQNPFA